LQGRKGTEPVRLHGLSEALIKTLVRGRTTNRGEEKEEGETRKRRGRESVKILGLTAPANS
jgi:hypothetical protein